jgi:acetyl esterase/lipase
MTEVQMKKTEIRSAWRLLLPSLMVLVLAPAGLAQVAADRAEIPLYDGVAPGSESAAEREVGFKTADGQRRLRNVVRPTLTAWWPAERPAGGLTAVIVAPGGGFMHLAVEKEGIEVARWLQERGIAAFVLKYRTMDTGATEAEFRRHQEVLAAALRPPRGAADSTSTLRQNPEWQNAMALAVADGQQAVRLVRQRSREWGIDPARVGLLGFSAGGMLTVGAVMGEVTGRPNFAAPIYGGSTNGAAIPAAAPPLFIAVADDDHLAAASSAKLYLEWRAAGHSAELHVYTQGGHGFGMLRRGLPTDGWIDRLGDWLVVKGLMKR